MRLDLQTILAIVIFVIASSGRADEADDLLATLEEPEPTQELVCDQAYTLLGGWQDVETKQAIADLCNGETDVYKRFMKKAE